VATNRVPWIVGGTLIALFVLGSLVFGSGSGEMTMPDPASLPESARAVKLPGEREYTVVVPPCGTRAEATVRNVKRDLATPGATMLTAPAREGVTTVLVPHCQPGTGATNAGGDLPSAAFVLPGEERTGEAQGTLSVNGAIARSQVLLPAGSEVETIVIPPCARSTAGGDVVLEAEEGSDTAVARAC